MAKMQVFTYDNLALYDELLKGYVDAGDAKSLKTVAIEGNTLKFYRVSEPVGDTVPAYTITLPEADLTGLIPKITGATAGNVVTAKADGTVEDSGIKASDLATKAEVKAVDDKAVANATAISDEADRAKAAESANATAISEEVTRAKAAEKVNSDAIAVLNGGDTQTGSVAKAVKDAKDSINATIGTVDSGKTVVQMISEAKQAGTDAQADVDALELVVNKLDGAVTVEGSVKKQIKDATDGINATIGDVTEGKTVVEMINDAKTAATYDDAEVRGLIQNNANAIEAHKTAIDAKVTTLVGEDADKSVRTIAAEETAKIVASAPEDFDTLKEVSDWIAADKTRAAELTTKVSNNEKAIADEVARATGVESGLETRLSAVETLVGEGGSVDEKIATAKQEAIDAAAADATTKANTAETNAKAHATSLNTAMDTRVTALEGLVGEGVEAIPEASIRALFA